MAFPYAERDYSMYSSSTNEGSVGKARHDLDRCAQILNEVLDNGAGILDGVKKRKSVSSPSKSTSVLQHKKLRQTNRVLEGENIHPGAKVSTSTPQQTPLTGARRQRSSSASSISSYYGRRGSRQRRHRSLSEQRSSTATGSRIRRELGGSLGGSLGQRSASVQSRLLDSVNSVIANHSMTSSEADTLTGLHMDNSSQFGVPPVFNARGERRLHKAAPRLRIGLSNMRSQCGNMGWLKPQASASTQTVLAQSESSTAVRPVKEKRRSIKAKIDSNQRCIQTNVLNTPCTSHPLPKSTKPSKKSSTHVLTCSSTKISNQKENDIDDLLEKTLTERSSNATPTQMELEDIDAKLSDCSNVQGNVTSLLEQLKAASHSQDRGEFDRTLDRVSSTLHTMLQDTSQTRTRVDDLLLPFQRESRELKEQVKYLKQQVSKLQPQRQHTTEGWSVDKGLDKALACDLSVKVVAAEARSSQLTNQLSELIGQLNSEKQTVAQLTNDIAYHCEQVDDLKRENMRLHLQLSVTDPGQNSADTHHKAAIDSNCKLELANQRLQTLQQSMRLVHTKLSHLSSHCDEQTSKQLTPILELCAHKLIESMGEPPNIPLQANSNNNSRWENKPANLAEVVSSNLAKYRVVDAAGTSQTGSRPTLLPSDTCKVSAGTRPLDSAFSGSTREYDKFADPLAAERTHRTPDRLASDSRYSVSRYFQEYHPEYSVRSTVPTSRLAPLAQESPWRGGEACPLSGQRVAYTDSNADERSASRPAHIRRDPQSSDYKRQLFTSSETPTSATTETSATPISGDQLHSTLISSPSDSTIPDDVSESASTLSMATTVADGAFREGLAQLDANIAKLRQSLVMSTLGSSL